MAFKFPLTELFSVEGQRKTVQSVEAFEAAIKEGWFEPDAHALEEAYQAKLAEQREFDPSPTMGKLPDGNGENLAGPIVWIDNPQVEVLSKISKSKRGKK